MTAKAQKSPPRLDLEPLADGTYRVVYPFQRRLRFLFTDATTVDVFTDRDTSDLRERLLVVLKKDGIAGVASVEDSDPQLPLAEGAPA